MYFDLEWIGACINSKSYVCYRNTWLKQVVQVTADQLYTEVISSIMTKFEMAENVAIWNVIFFALQECKRWTLPKVWKVSHTVKLRALIRLV